MALTREQLRIRKAGISASDAVAILGISPWKTALDVYLDKVDTNIDAKERRGSEAMDLGNAVEDHLTKKLVKYFDLHHEHSRNETVSVGWKIATPDIHLHGKWVGEVKMVGSRKMSDWSDFPPDYVRAQVVWQMIVTNAEVGYICAAIGGTDVRYYTVKATKNEREAMIELCEKFWKDRVLAGRPPVAENLEDAKRLILHFYPKSNGESREATDQEVRLANDYVTISKKIKELEDEREKCRLRLMNAMGETEEITHEKFSIKSASRKTTSWKEICQHMNASRELITQYTREGERYLSIRER